MLIDDGVAEFGIAATLEPARGRGCQLALLHRRILDAAAAGCHTLFVETGERVPGPPLRQLPQHPPRRLRGGLPAAELARPAGAERNRTGVNGFAGAFTGSAFPLAKRNR